ncbi:MAG TPA: JAB domain-containing protein [Saprospiraceae bacterium]|nr:JAB domain-containing protein [Saprospiraceae bacterium]
MKKTVDQNEKSHCLSEIEVTYKTKVKISEMHEIMSSKDAEKIFRDVWSEKIEMQEEVMILLMNRKNKVLGWYRISSGGISSTLVDQRIVFSIALKTLASAIIVAHNHPSGNTSPSEADKSLTRVLKECGKLLDINVLDHLILTQDSFYSFADEGMM